MVHDLSLPLPQDYLGWQNYTPAHSAGACDASGHQLSACIHRGANEAFRVALYNFLVTQLSAGLPFPWCSVKKVYGQFLETLIPTESNQLIGDEGPKVWVVVDCGLMWTGEVNAQGTRRRGVGDLNARYVIRNEVSAESREMSTGRIQDRGGMAQQAVVNLGNSQGACFEIVQTHGPRSFKLHLNNLSSCDWQCICPCWVPVADCRPSTQLWRSS